MKGNRGVMGLMAAVGFMVISLIRLLTEFCLSLSSMSINGDARVIRQTGPFYSLGSRCRGE